MSKVLPFRWVGTKRWMTNELIERLPEDLYYYLEPFCGRCDFFFAISDRIKKAYLSDNNKYLINAIQEIKCNAKALIKKLEIHERNKCEQYYYYILNNTKLSNPLWDASVFIHVMNNCYKGIFALVDKNGRFKTRWFGCKSKKFDEGCKEDLLWCSSVLNDKAVIECRDFEYAIPPSGSLVSFDPPYPKENKSKSGYDSNNGEIYKSFDLNDQRRLYRHILGLTERGVNVITTNLNCDFIKGMYNDSIFRRSIIKRNSRITWKSIEELIITNYETKETRMSSEKVIEELRAARYTRDRGNFKQERDKAFVDGVIKALEYAADTNNERPIPNFDVSFSKNKTQNFNENTEGKKCKRLKPIPEDLRLKIIEKQGDRSNVKMANELNITTNTLKNLRDGKGTFRQGTLADVGELVGWSNNHSSAPVQ